MSAKRTRQDLALVASLIEPDATVLDIGCGDGALLEMLARERGAHARGMEISRKGVSACVARGLAVVQGDANLDLADYPDDAFDYIILTQTIQAMQRPREVLGQIMRVGRRAVLSFPNFGHWRLRLSLLVSGRMPRSNALPSEWYDTDNIHLCTIRDFAALCKKDGAEIEKAFASRHDTAPRPFTPRGLSLTIENLFAEEAIFLLRPSSAAPERKTPPPTV